MTDSHTLITPRLTLQPLSSEHAEDLFPIYSDSRTMTYWHTLPHQSVDDTAKMIAQNLRSGGFTWIVRLRDSGKIIGSVGYIAAMVSGMGYILHPDYWRQGYATEAVNAALGYCFETMNINRIELWIHADNIASQKLANKLGFIVRSQFYQRFGHHSEPHETLVFGLRADEWARRQNGTPLNPQPEVAFFGVNPVIQVRSVAATAVFYKEKLGFNVDYSEGFPLSFAIMSRGEWTFERAQIHFAHSDSPPPPGQLYFNIGVSADRLHDEFVANGVAITGELVTHPYGRREFSITDNNGWLLRFASAV